MAPKSIWTPHSSLMQHCKLEVSSGKTPSVICLQILFALIFVTLRNKIPTCLFYKVWIMFLDVLETSFVGPQ